MKFNADDFNWMLSEENQEFFKGINPILQIISRDLVQIPKTEFKPPIIITGPPRCGSTVVSQIFAEAFDVGYISNFIARFWMAPALGAYLWKNLGLRREISYESFRASTKALGDISEFNYFWNRFFDDSHSHYCEKLDTELKSELVHDLEEISFVFEKNLMIKYVLGAFKIGVLKDAMPNMKFVVIKRNPIYIAQSLLKIRRQVFGTIEEWWSLKPREIDVLKKMNPYEQVVAQTYYTYKELENRSKQFPDDFLTIEYESFLNNPDVVLGRVVDKFNLKFRDEYDLPKDKLVASKKQISDENEINKIKEYIGKYFEGDKGDKLKVTD
jgi:hypothetical protein